MMGKYDIKELNLIFHPIILALCIYNNTMDNKL